MFFSVLTAIFFAFSVLFARRSSSYVGSQPANLGRQGIALVILACWAHTAGQGMHGPSLAVLVISGMIGFGLGDWALFEALPRIGAPMTILLCQCVAAPIGAITERVCLGTEINTLQMLSAAVILLGVALAIAPEKDSDIPHGHRWLGVMFGLIAATGQGWGAVLTRYGFLQAAQAHFELDGLTAAYQRLWGGVLTIGTIILVKRFIFRLPPSGAVKRPDWSKGLPWIFAHALFGPIFGVTCYALAFKAAPTGIVLPIVATTPLVTMLISFFWEGTRPSRKALIGSVLAVTGVVLLVSLKTE